MRIAICSAACLGAVLAALVTPPSAPAQSLDAGKATAALSATETLTLMRRVADWQLANPSKHKPTDWTQAAFYASMMALADMVNDPKYVEAMVRMGETNAWRLGARKFHGDDHCVGQTYCELFFRSRDPKLI